MKRTFSLLFTLLSAGFFLGAQEPKVIGEGEQPVITMDHSGTLRIVFGEANEILCSTSSDNGNTFSAPESVASVPGMHLGASRGPQAASSSNYSVVTAINKAGDIYSFYQAPRSGSWKRSAMVNDKRGSAPEGLMGLAAGENDDFYAVWLDIRHGNRNNLCFSRSMDHGKTWSKNMMIYISPDEHVCECCKPNIAVSGKHVYIMFRNWLNGSRDLYLIESDNHGNTFGNARKLGEGSWKLNACPMDGGGLAVNTHNQVATVWQRAGKIFFARPGHPEIEMGEGRLGSIAGADHPVIAWQDGGEILAVKQGTGNPSQIGEGSFVSVLKTANQRLIFTWEDDTRIYVKTEVMKD